MQNYKSINENSSFKKKVVFYFGAGGAGFYSEYNSMLYIILYCYFYKIKFSIFSKNNKMFGGKGYTYVFKDILLENTNSIHIKINKRFSDYHYFERTKDVLVKEKFLLTAEYFYKLITGNYLTQDLFNESRSVKFTSKTFDFPELGIKGNFHDALSQLVSQVYVFNDDYQKKIQQKISSLNLPSKYVAMHVRGGDKIIESDLYGSEIYMSKAIEESTVRNAFVFTDDYNILKSLRQKYSDWNFYSFVSEEETGYVNNDFLHSGSDIIDSKMLNLFSSVEVIKNAEKFIGTCSSNVGAFIGLYMPLSKVIYVDTDKWHFQ